MGLILDRFRNPNCVWCGTEADFFLVVRVGKDYESPEIPCCSRDCYEKVAAYERMRVMQERTTWG